MREGKGQGGREGRAVRVGVGQLGNNARGFGPPPAGL